MTEKPILFNSEMVRAILDGRKTQTRRPVKDETLVDLFDANKRAVLHIQSAKDNRCVNAISPYQIGDLLYVRESIETSAFGTMDTDQYHQFYYVADSEISVIKYPSRLKAPKIGHKYPNGCYKEAARIWLKVTDVRVERVQDIGNDDCIREGFDNTKNTLHGAFRDTWNSIYPGSWDLNEWVWVTEFKKIEKG